MSLWSRIANVFRGDRLNRDIEEELQSHIAEAITEGRDPGEARRAFGSVLSHRERSRDIRLIPWLESLCAASKEKGDVGCGRPFPRSRHWVMRRCLPAHGRYAMAAITDCRA
jgi:hypothetical protein